MSRQPPGYFVPIELAYGSLSHDIAVERRTISGLSIDSGLVRRMNLCAPQVSRPRRCKQR